MPTLTEFNELLNKCTWTWITYNGVNGFKVTSKKPGYTDRSIFLPACGERLDASLINDGSDGGYWSSENNPILLSYVGYLSFSSGRHKTKGRNRNPERTAAYSDRDFGRSVRPVCP